MLETVKPAVSTRYVYDRMTGAQLSTALDQLGLTMRGFGKIYGVPAKRMQAWLKGDEDIPHSVAVMVGLLTLPGAVDLANAYTDSVAHDVRSDND